MTRFYVRATATTVRRHLSPDDVLIASDSPVAWTAVEVEGCATPHADPLDRVSGLPRARLEALSHELGTDVVWLAHCARSEAFHFVHWDRGEHLRELAYGCLEEREWDRVAGYPEAWESGRSGVNVLPVRLDPEDTARTIARHYRLAGWEDDWDETREWLRGPGAWVDRDDDETEEGPAPPN